MLLIMRFVGRPPFLQTLMRRRFDSRAVGSPKRVGHVWWKDSGRFDQNRVLSHVKNPFEYSLGGLADSGRPSLRNIIADVS